MRKIKQSMMGLLTLWTATFPAVSCGLFGGDSSSMHHVSSTTYETPQESVIEPEIEEFLEEYSIDMFGLYNLMDTEQTFALLLYKPGCGSCDTSVPLVADFGLREIRVAENDEAFTRLDIYFMNTQLNREYLQELEELLFPYMYDSDISLIEGTLYVPNLTAFKKGRPIISRTGLPYDQEGVDRRLIDHKNLLLTQ